MRRSILLPILACAIATAVLHSRVRAGDPPQAVESFTLEQVMSYSFPSEMVAAPSGARLAWVFNAQGRRNVWAATCVAPCDAAKPKFTARWVTRFREDDGQDIGDLEFSADGNTIVFVRGGPKNQAGEVPNPLSDPAGVEQAVWAVAVNGIPASARKIDAGRAPAISKAGWVAYIKDQQLWIAPLSGVSQPKQIFARGQNGALTWSPDGRQLAFASGRGSHSFIAVYDVVKRSVSYLAASVDRDSAPRWSPDGKSIAFIRQPARMTGEGGGNLLLAPDQPRPWGIWVADVSSGKAREVWRSGTRQEDSISGLGGDLILNWAAGGRLVFASEMDGWMHLYSMPSADGEPILLTPGDCDVEQMTFTPKRDAIVYASNCTNAPQSKPEDIDRRHLWRVAVSGGQAELLTPGDGIEFSPVVTADGRFIAHFRSDARQPAMPFVRGFRASGDGMMLATQMLPKDFPSAKLVLPQQVITTAPDGQKIHNQLFLPADIKFGERRPAIVYMHGGPVRQMLLGWHYRGYYHGDYAMNQYLASRGYVVLSVNYRSGIGYGRAFREAKDRGARGASEYQDVVAGAKYLQQRPDVDPKRVGLWGGSYGGYLTAMGLARNSDIFAAGVDLHGVHDWSVRFGGGGGPGGPPTGDRARVARAASPVADVEKWRSPVLLIHGDDDRNVDFAQTVDLAARLRRQGVYFEQLVYPDDVHDFLLFKHWRGIFSTAADFFDRQLKNRQMAEEK